MFSYILSQMGSNLMQGKSVINISLPINIFDKKSNLVRMAETYRYAPVLLAKRGNELEKLIALYFSIQYLYIKLTKPFNPILGETYQGVVAGCKIEIEQVSHHPPICYVIFSGKGYRITQKSESIANISVNSVRGQNLGWIKLRYDDGHTLMLTNQNLFGVLGGNLFGDKLFQMEGELRCCDYTNDLVGLVQFEKPSIFSSERVLTGGIFKTDDPRKTANYMNLDCKHLQKLRFIHGNWYENFKVDNDEYWNRSMNAHSLIDDPHCLPSDSRFREDVLAWLLDDFDLAMERKVKLEEIQRFDRKLRKH